MHWDVSMQFQTWWPFCSSIFFTLSLTHTVIPNHKSSKMADVQWFCLCHSVPFNDLGLDHPWHRLCIAQSLVLLCIHLYQFNIVCYCPYCHNQCQSMVLTIHRRDSRPGEVYNKITEWRLIQSLLSGFFLQSILQCNTIVYLFFSVPYNRIRLV